MKRLTLRLAALLVCACTGSSAFAKPAADARRQATAEIDRILEEGHAANDIKALPRTSDEIFVRRIYLDISGRIPTGDEALRFLENKHPEKRSRLISQLLASPGYVHHFYNYWADLLRAKTQLAGNGQSTTAGMAYADWIKDSLRENKPYDQMVQELLTADGLSIENGAVGFYIRDYGMPLDQMAVTTQVFLGSQVVCAQCHDHPFDEWTQKQYYQLAAYTYGMQTSNQPPLASRTLTLASEKKLGESQVRDIRKASSEILKPLRFNNVYTKARIPRLPADYQYEDAKPKQTIPPTIPVLLAGHGEAASAPVAPFKQILEGEAPNPVWSYAAWMTSRDNERFATVIANRLWKKAMGYGVIEPVDEFTESTEPSNPELLAELSELIVDLDFDMKAFLEVVFNTAAYQREAYGEDHFAGMPYHFPGPMLRRMTAEQIWDSINTLLIDEPDAYSPEAALRAQERYHQVRLLADGVYNKSPGQYLNEVRQVAKVQKTLAAEMEEISIKLQEARDAEDAQLIRKYSQEGLAKRRELAQKVQEIVYVSALQDDPKSSELTSALVAASSSAVRQGGNTPLPADLIPEDTASELASCQNVGDIVKVVNREARAELKAFYKQREQHEREEWGVTAKTRKAWEIFDTQRRRDSFSRASELPSPAPNGHFLREFGQSDREMVENANDGASITQALQLLNGRVHSALENKFVRINRELFSFPDADDRVDALFLNTLSRRPTGEEREIFLPLLTGKMLPTSVRIDAIWPILNSRQFLFVQ